MVICSEPPGASARGSRRLRGDSIPMVLRLESPSLRDARVVRLFVGDLFPPKLPERAPVERPNNVLEKPADVRLDGHKSSGERRRGKSQKVSGESSSRRPKRITGTRTSAKISNNSFPKSRTCAIYLLFERRCYGGPATHCAKGVWRLSHSRWLGRASVAHQLRSEGRTRNHSQASEMA